MRYYNLKLNTESQNAWILRCVDLDNGEVIENQIYRRKYEAETVCDRRRESHEYENKYGNARTHISYEVVPTWIDPGIHMIYNFYVSDIVHNRAPNFESIAALNTLLAVYVPGNGNATLEDAMVDFQRDIREMTKDRKDELVFVVEYVTICE